MHGSRLEQRILLFRVAGHFCALNISVIQEIVPLAATVRLPGQPPIVEGFLNLRGHAVPVVPLARCFGSPAAEPDLHSPIIVVRTSGGVTGLLVDAVDGVATLEDHVLQPLEQQYSFNGCATGRFNYENRDVALLEADRLLLNQEQQCVAHLAELAQQRLAELRGADA